MMDIGFAASFLGAVQGQIARVVKNYFEHKKLKTELKYSATASIRSIRNKRFLNMQSFVAFMIIFYVCLAPFIACLLKIPVEFGYLESNGWIASTFSGKANVLWYQVDGFPIGPVHAYLASSVTFYFLGSTGR